MMDTNQCQKLFPQGIQGNSAFKTSKMNIDSQIDNGILQQLGAGSINQQSMQVGPNGMYGSMNTTLLNSQNIGSGGNQNTNTNQTGQIGSGNKTQSILGITNANGNQYGNLVGNINQQNSGFMNFSYQLLDNGLTGLGGNLANGQQQGKQIGLNQNNFNGNSNPQQINFNGMGINKNDNIVDFNSTKGLFQNQFKNIINPQQNQSMLIESTQNFLKGGMGLDSIQLQQSCDQNTQNQKLMYQEMMKNSGNQLDNSHHFSSSKQNQMQSSQNSLNNGLNSFLGGQNGPSPFILGYDQSVQQQQQKLMLLQQQQQQQQLLQDQIKQPNFLQLQQLRKLNNLNSIPNSHQQNNPSNKVKSFANEILNDVSDVESDVDDKQKQLIESNFNTNMNNDFLMQMRDFYNIDQTQEAQKKQKKDNISARKQEHLQLYIEKMVTKFQGSIETHIKNYQKMVEAISQIQVSTAFIQNTTKTDTNKIQGSNDTHDKNQQISNYDQVFETWEYINEVIEDHMEKIQQTLKLSLEEAIWNFHIAFNSQQINEKKSKLTNFAAKKIFDEKYEYNQSNNEVTRSLDIIIQSKYDKSQQSQQQESFIKNVIDQSSDYIFTILEEPQNQTVFLGYIHKISKMKQGRGIFINENNVYQGYFDNNKPSGIGRIIYSSCNIYEGSFQNGLQNGKGKYTWANGNVYEGTFEKGRRSGRGKFMWKDGRIYDGFCTNDVANGFGEYTNCIFNSHKNSNNPYCFEIYRGNWKNNKMDGKGILFVGVQAEWKENQLININQMVPS